MSGNEEPYRVVLAPDVIARSFFDPECRAVLDHWRDGAVRIVVTRELLMLYLRLLRKIEIPDTVLRRWLVWFTASDKSVCLEESGSVQENLSKTLYEAARRGAVETIVSNMPEPSVESEVCPAENCSWTLVNDFLAGLCGKSTKGE